MKPYILITAIMLSLLGGLSSCEDTHKLRGRPIDIYSEADTVKNPTKDTAIVEGRKIDEPGSDD